VSVGRYVGVLVSRSVGLSVCRYISLSLSANAQRTSVCQYIRTSVHPCVGASPRQWFGASVCVLVRRRIGVSFGRYYNSVLVVGAVGLSVRRYVRVLVS